MERTDREKRIIRNAIDGLCEYYPVVLADETFAQELASSLTVPDTDNDQADYQTLKDALETRVRDYNGPSKSSALDSLIEAPTAKVEPDVSHALSVFQDKKVLVIIHIRSSISYLRDDEIESWLDAYAKQYAVVREGLTGCYARLIDVDTPEEIKRWQR